MNIEAQKSVQGWSELTVFVITVFEEGPSKAVGQTQWRRLQRLSIDVTRNVSCMAADVIISI